MHAIVLIIVAIKVNSIVQGEEQTPMPTDLHGLDVSFVVPS
jgi:hypothetical protein